MITALGQWPQPPRRLGAAVRALLLLQATGFAFMVAGTHGAFTPLPLPPTTTDFASFYVAGVLANRGTPALAYDPAAHARVEGETVAPGVEEKRFLNPPPFLLLCAPLAWLPYLAAFVLFEAVTLGLWLMLTTRVAGGGGLAAMALGCIPSVWWALGWGQNSFLSASLMAAGTLLLRRSPWLAGAAFGALCFKPHFGLMIPVALLAGRRWCALAGTALAVGSLCALSTVCFGIATWRGFLGMARHARAAIETGIELAGHVDLAGAVRLLGVSASVSWSFQAVAAVVSATCVALVWSALPAGPKHRPGTYEAAFAVLVAATLTSMPFLLFYDLVMAGLAIAWLLRASRECGFRRSDAIVIYLAFGLNLLAFPTAILLHTATGALVGPLLLWSSMRCWTRSNKRRCA